MVHTSVHARNKDLYVLSVVVMAATRKYLVYRTDWDLVQADHRTLS